jgi:hypothetical protein
LTKGERRRSVAPVRHAHVLMTDSSGVVHSRFSASAESKGVDLNFRPKQFKLPPLLEELFWGS